MIISNKKIYLQITSGRGPAECCRAVTLVLEKVLKQAKDMRVLAEVIEREPGPMNRTLYSAILSLEGDGSSVIADGWQGTIQWISQSPYRIHHRRKNWFVAVNLFIVSDFQGVDSKYFAYQSLRASGPGGQHVNKTESAVRVTHIPSGLCVTASDQRSQVQNKKIATERLLVKLEAWKIEQVLSISQDNWSNHNSVERGNPLKVIKEQLR